MTRSAQPGRPASAFVRLAVAAVATSVTLLAAELGTRYVFRDVHSSADGRTFFAHRGGPEIRGNSLGLGSLQRSTRATQQRSVTREGRMGF